MTLIVVDVLEGSTILALSALKIATVALGLTIVYLGWKAWRATRRKPMLYFTIGIAVMTVGAVAEGLAYQLFLDLDVAHLVEAVFTLAAFAILVYSLFA